MLKIMALESEGNRELLRLEGRVIGPWVDELRRFCEQVLEGGAPLTLDIAEVAFVERDGVHLLQRLIDRGVAVVNCPAFVTEQLKAVSPC